MQTISTLSQSSRLFCKPAKNPYSRHIDTERVEESARSAQRSRAAELCLPRLASHRSSLYLSVTWDEKRRAYRRPTQYERSYTSSRIRRRRSCLRAAMAPVCCGSPVRSPELACPSRVPASSPTSLHRSLFLVPPAHIRRALRGSLWFTPGDLF